MIKLNLKEASDRPKADGKDTKTAIQNKAMIVRKAGRNASLIPKMDTIKTPSSPFDCEAQRQIAGTTGARCSPHPVPFASLSKGKGAQKDSEERAPCTHPKESCELLVLEAPGGGKRVVWVRKHARPCIDERKYLPEPPFRWYRSMIKNGREIRIRKYPFDDDYLKKKDQRGYRSYKKRATTIDWAFQRAEKSNPKIVPLPPRFRPNPSKLQYSFTAKVI